MLGFEPFVLGPAGGIGLRAGGGQEHGDERDHQHAAVRRQPGQDRVRDVAGHVGVRG